MIATVEWWSIYVFPMHVIWYHVHYRADVVIVIILIVSVVYNHNGLGWVGMCWGRSWLLQDSFSYDPKHFYDRNYSKLVK